ncbi:MAG: tryptophan-rich sensory protein [Anaerolineae bacterium]|nr:tryptophan-rich sensory protein [Anaerolineae bacterium]MDW8098431.1 tryptophan-rich sensory protein [Anaerolineae bacterium]
MSIKTQQIVVILTTLFTLTINALSNALPLNGLTTDEISDRFQVYFVPAGYVFSVWGLIYIGMIAFTIYQALPTQRYNPRLEGVRGWFILSNLANAGWLFLWHYEQFPVTLLAMGTLLVSLIAIYLRLRLGRGMVPALERWSVDALFSIYLGWITVATIANVTAVLDYAGWNQFGLSDAVWMVVMLTVVAAVAWAMSLRERDWAYLAVLLWSLAGIGVKFPSEGAVTIATWTAFVVVGLALLWTVIRPQAGRLASA